MAAWIRRRQGIDRLPVSLQRARLYILPTRTGIAFAALLLVMLIAGLNYANSLALLMTFLLAGVALVAMHACHRNLVGLRIAELSCEDSFAGESAALRLRVGTDTAQARFAVEFGIEAEAVVCTVPAHGESVVELKLSTPLRGLMPVGRVRVLTTWPFGLFRAWTWLHVPDRVTVYPRPVGRRAMPAAAAAPGASVPQRSGEADEWATLRPFRDGDSPRQVAWKAYARGAPLLVKEYTASAGAERMFDFAAIAGADAEQRLSQLARWIVQAAADGERFGLRLPLELITLDRGQAHRRRCLRALARFDAGVAADD